MQHDHALQLIRQMRAPIRLALGEGLFLAVIGVRQMVNTGQRIAEPFTVGNHAAHRNAAKAHAMIAALTPDEPLALAFAARTVIGKRHFHGRISRFRTRIAEKRIVQIARGQCGQLIGEFENLRMAILEGRREIEFGCLFLDRVHDGLTAMAGIAAPQASRPVQNGAALHVVIMHILGARDQPGTLLERRIGREPHEKGFQIVRRRLPARRVDIGGLVHDRVATPERFG